MNCRDFIKEYEERQTLTETAQLHLNHCPGCRKTTIVQTHIWEAIDGLAAVDAPKNFEFRVKARIANAQPGNFRPKFLPVLRYVLPLAAVAPVLGLLAFNPSLFVRNSGAPESYENVVRSPIVAEAPSNGFAPPAPEFVNANTAPVPNEEVAILNPNQNAKLPDGKQPQSDLLKSMRKLPTELRRENLKKNSDGIGSRDIAGTDPKVLMPEGIPNMALENPSNTGNKPADKDVWSQIGVVTVLEKGSRKVRTVKPNSPAASAGVRAGDVIEAFTGGKSAVKTLTIRRGAQKLRINIQTRTN